MVGSAGAAALSRTLRTLQYGVTVSQSTSWLLDWSLLLLVVAAALWRPARAAIRLDPNTVLRDD